MDFQRLFYINHEFENRTFDWVRLIFFLFGEFDFVRLKFSSIGFDLLCRDNSRNARNTKTFIVLLLLTSSKYISCFRFESTLEL